MSSLLGKVKWFDPKKGYGFIVGPSNQDVFVHYTQIRGDGFRSLKDGESVNYEMIEGEKGFQARGVSRILDGGEASSTIQPSGGTGLAGNDVRSYT